MFSAARTLVRVPTWNVRDLYESPDQGDGITETVLQDAASTGRCDLALQHRVHQPSSWSLRSGGLGTDCAVAASMSRLAVAGSKRDKSDAQKQKTVTGFSVAATERAELHLCNGLALCKKRKKPGHLRPSISSARFLYFCLCEKATVTKSQRQSDKSCHFFFRFSQFVEKT